MPSNWSCVQLLGKAVRQSLKDGEIDWDVPSMSIKNTFLCIADAPAPGSRRRSNSVPGCAPVCTQVIQAQDSEAVDCLSWDIPEPAVTVAQACDSYACSPMAVPSYVSTSMAVTTHTAISDPAAVAPPGSWRASGS